MGSARSIHGPLVGEQNYLEAAIPEQFEKKENEEEEKKMIDNEQ